jgi:hypothetical protein
VNKKKGKLTATWTNDTANGLASRFVISHREPASYIARPIFATALPIQMAVNAAWLKAPHLPGAPSPEDDGEVESALKLFALLKWQSD